MPRRGLPYLAATHLGLPDRVNKIDKRILAAPLQIVPRHRSPRQSRPRQTKPFPTLPSHATTRLRKLINEILAIPIPATHCLSGPHLTDPDHATAIRTGPEPIRN